MHGTQSEIRYYLYVIVKQVVLCIVLRFKNYFYSAVNITFVIICAL